MTLKIYTADWHHKPEISKYNHNIYKYVGAESQLHGKELLVICNENYEFYDFRLDGVFIGCSYESMDKVCVEVDYLVYYT